MLGSLRKTPHGGHSPPTGLGPTYGQLAFSLQPNPKQLIKPNFPTLTLHCTVYHMWHITIKPFYFPIYHDVWGCELYNISLTFQETILLKNVSTTEIFMRTTFRAIVHTSRSRSLFWKLYFLNFSCIFERYIQ